MTGQAESPWDGSPGPASWIRPPATLRTLVVGAGRAGRALARELRDAAGPHGTEGQELRPIGFVDDARDPFANSEAQPEPAMPLLGTLAELAHLVAEHAAEAVLLAIPGLPTARARELTAAATGAGAVVRYLPWHAAHLPREATASDLRPLDIRALIDGPAPHAVSPEVKEIVTGKRVLVTGAGGALGAELSRHLHAFNPGELFLLDGDESAMHHLAPDLYATLLTTDLSDRDQTDRTFRDLRPEVVFHAAGPRQASVLERRPSLGVKANVLSTDNLVRAVARHGTERFVRISTDADPATMLGASQRAAEAVIRAAAAKSAKKHTNTVYTAVRVGDALDAHASLLTVLADQIRAGGPVTITHPDATRRFATVEEAVALALEAARTATGGEVSTPDLGAPTRIADVVERFTRQYKLPEVPIRCVSSSQKAKNPWPAEPTRPAEPTQPADYADLPDRLDKLYKAAEKNRDPKVRQMLAKLAKPSPDRPR
ncbi:FlaA1/EpsC-like NDP-sugar epimerase [Catenulispora sp. EB89]|uniref:polysaccharide biosynthesis protein n=1 Tax=Catenulispora sp. EB89 TaxID=3156257 RepID=UPI003514C100